MMLVMDDRLQWAQTLPASWYFDEALLQHETQKLFHRTWQLVAKTSDVPVPGSFFTTELVGEPLLITRDSAGGLHGFYNVCRHRAGPVAVGCGTRKALQCAYHGWIYGLDGHLMSAREMDGTENFDHADFGLVPVQIAQWGPLIFVNLDRQAPPFEQVFGAVMTEVQEQGFDLSRMATVERRDYDIACNWKVYVDNYLEGYHIPIVHPGLFQELDYDQYEVVTYAQYSKQFAPVRPTTAQSAADRRYGRYVDDGQADADAQALYYWIFPNLMLNIYPDNISTNVILPRGVGRTLTIFEWFANPEASAEDMKQTIDFSEEIQQEDIFICEAVQKGLASQSYDRGRYSAKRENGVHHFHMLLAKALR
ncbi:MAG: (2Fe-2S)-binding protein [Sulfobacillus acidophilus]|uniref:(2Fe-2S)-binding protein n=1 Tax=Sulfobacillus acidophilus TaxID=53633 RepID=A0A2T2WMT4_9FIRM|nr:MAG: (2Fe-2S)-binding protein [Sulfobacillus acidophilus]